MTRIALTGAAGNVGRALLAAFGRDGNGDTGGDDRLADHGVDPAVELVAFTHAEHDDLDAELLDVTDPDDVRGKLRDVDVVVHLAGASSPHASWDDAVDVNVRGTKHVLDAAVENGVDRVVFASSNHAVGTYNALAVDDPEDMTTGPVDTVDPDDPPRPDSFYGVSKVACEAVGNYYADRRALEVVNVRIGWYMTRSTLREIVAEADTPGAARFARAMWLSPRDCRDVLLGAATADLAERPVTVNAVSRNDDRFLSITETMRAVGYAPRDDAAEVLAAPVAAD